MFYGMDPGAEHGFKLQHLLMFKILEKVRLQSKVCGEPSSAIRWSSEAGSLQTTTSCSRPSSDEHPMKQVQGSRSLRSALQGQKSGCNNENLMKQVQGSRPSSDEHPMKQVQGSRPSSDEHPMKQVQGSRFAKASILMDM